MALFTTQPTILETARLYVSELSPEIYLQLINEGSDEEIMAYLGLSTREGVKAEKEKVTKGLTSCYVTFKNFRLLDKVTGNVIGRCDFHTWIQKHRRAEIGYHLTDDSYKNKGLMTEALGAVLVFGFEHMNLHRIEALIDEHNEPSRRLLEHYGFSREGILRQHYYINDVNEDSVMFSLTRSDYELLKERWS